MRILLSLNFFRRGLVGQQQPAIAKQTDQQVPLPHMRSVAPTLPNIPILQHHHTLIARRRSVTRHFTLRDQAEERAGRWRNSATKRLESPLFRVCPVKPARSLWQKVIGADLQRVHENKCRGDRRRTTRSRPVALAAPTPPTRFVPSPSHRFQS